MIWVALLATAIFLAIVSWGDKPSRRALLACAAGIVAMQIFKVANMGNLIWLCSASVWASVGVYLLKVNGRDTAICAFLLIASGLCYAAGRAAGGQFATGNPLMIAADLLGIIAMLLGGWRGVCVTRGCWMGRGVLGLHRRTDYNSSACVGGGAEKRIRHSHV